MPYPAPTTPDPIEIAMAAEAGNTAADSPARRLLVDHGRLVRWQMANERAAFALRVLTGLAGVAVVVALTAIIWDASRASGAVIEPFDSAPSLVAQGLTGEAIANELQSRITALDMAGSDRPQREASSGAEQIDVVIPQTGVSIGEAQRLLRGWLGDETHVTGALRPTPTGELELSLRVDGRRVDVAPPPADQLGSADAWMAAAAEAALREIDPFRYVSLLNTRGRFDEAKPILNNLRVSGSVTDRAWAWTATATNLRRQGDLAGGLAASRIAYRLDPNSDSTANGLVNHERLLGHTEAVRFYARVALRATDPKNRARVSHRTAQAMSWENDWLGAYRQTGALMARQQWGRPQYPIGLGYIHGLALTRLHEPSATGLFAADLRLGDDMALRVGIETIAEAGRWSEATPFLERPWQPDVADPGLGLYRDRIMRWPWQAYVAAREGRFDAAREIAARTPTDCYLCVRMRGRIEALAGQPATADRWFSEAVRQGPSLADADHEWAEAKLARGDRNGALVLAAQAARKAPRWADPLKLQGDVRLATGDAKAAARAYADASVLAPRWGALHLKWGEALAKLGKADEARAKWRAAATMDLSAADRARLNTLLVGRPA